MKTATLQIAQLKRKRFGIVYGGKVIQSFKTEEIARHNLKTKAAFYKYWAESASVSVDMSSKIIKVLS